MPLFKARQVVSTITSVIWSNPAAPSTIFILTTLDSAPVSTGSVATTAITGTTSSSAPGSSSGPAPGTTSSSPSATTPVTSATSTEQTTAAVPGSQSSSATAPANTLSSSAPGSVYAYSTVLTSPVSSGAVITGQQNYTYPVTSSFPFTTTAAEVLPAGYQVSGYVNVTVPSQAPSPKHHSLSSGATAGIAIGTAIIGALIAGIAVLMLTRKKRSRRHAEPNNALTQSEKTTRNSAYTDKAAPFDLDRLLPQPLDDAAMRNQAQNLFAQIDAHVDSFYSDAKLNANKGPAVGVNQDQQATEMLANPATRLFMIKKIITAAMLDSISPECSSNRSLLPYGFTTVARRLRDPSVDDHATSLSWSRLRTSFAFLLRHDSDTDRGRLDAAAAAVVENLNSQSQPYELSGSTDSRNNDLQAICKETAKFGNVLLAQPATWSFDWTANTSQSGRQREARSRPGLVYFPALMRLTDNKSRKVRPRHCALEAKIMQ